MNDIATELRKANVAIIASEVASDDPVKERARLATIHGADNVWNTSELQDKFRVLGFAAPFCVVQDKATNEKGTVEFQHSPRFYFNYRKD